ncbi:MAG TPA: NAD-dependent deacylase [Terracidiphilus sp.]|nr:NAD-dependent deacylase [Terracidiphilus sp.]
MVGTAGRIVVLTGAGISAESGVPTFRGSGGLWRNYSAEDLATPEAFARNPRLVWEWYDWRRGIIHQAEPNAGHLALAALERQTVGRSAEDRSFTLITQNVDGLHERAGSRRVVRLHGDIWRVRCTGCDAEERNEEVPLHEVPPRCRCGSLLRPGVVWFGEPLPRTEWHRACEASGQARVMLVVGTSAVVYPAAGLAELAQAAGAKLAIINPGKTPLDSAADWVIGGTAGDTLPQLL